MHRKRFVWVGCLGFFGICLFGCGSSDSGGDGGLAGVEDGGAASSCGVTGGSGDQVFQVPSQRKVDFLFTIDNSGSMCEEQVKLVQAFNTLAPALVNGVDFRIAVANTDIRTETAKGRFQYQPPGIQVTDCDGTPTRATCDSFLGADGHFTFGPILKSGADGNFGATAGDLFQRFQCLASLGVGGDGFEKGLEGMRLSLSCEGPNRDRFAACCTDVKDAAGALVSSTYDPNCAAHLAPGQAPDFLRPDAALVVVALSDETDCSDPASNPKASRRAICKYGPSDGGDVDTLPDGFLAPGACPSGDTAACYQAECGELTPEQCYQVRCVIGRGNNNNCAWYPEALTPVQDYVDFLSGLKADPARQIVVASIVGPRAFLTDASGQSVEVHNVPGTPSEMCLAVGPDGVPYTTVSRVSLECCPAGQCTGGLAPTCQGPAGNALTGVRYLQLAEAFGGGADPTPICADSYQAPLQRLTDTLGALDQTLCLSRVPKCWVPVNDTHIAKHRACQTDEERAVISNYTDGVTAKLACDLAAGTGCAVAFPETDLAGRFSVKSAPVCPSGLALVLAEPPPAGATVTLSIEGDPASGCRVEDPTAQVQDAAPPPVWTGVDAGILPDSAALIVPDAATAILPDAAGP